MNPLNFVLVSMAMFVGLETSWATITGDEEKMMVETYYVEFFLKYLNNNEKCLEASRGQYYWDLITERCIPCEKKDDEVEDNLSQEGERHHACSLYFNKKNSRINQVKNRKCFEQSGGTKYYDQNQNICVSYDFSSQDSRMSGMVILTIINFLVTIALAALMVFVVWKTNAFRQNKNQNDEEVRIPLSNKVLMEDKIGAINKILQDWSSTIDDLKRFKNSFDEKNQNSLEVTIT